MGPFRVVPELPDWEVKANALLLLDGNMLDGFLELSQKSLELFLRASNNICELRKIDIDYIKFYWNLYNTILIFPGFVVTFKRLILVGDLIIRVLIRVFVKLPKVNRVDYASFVALGPHELGVARPYFETCFKSNVSFDCSSANIGTRP